jgi:hypothetical protein
MEINNGFSPWSANSVIRSPRNQQRNSSDDNGSSIHDRTGSLIGCRSSANYVSGVMSKFDEQKKGLVNSIGFGGLLELHEMSKVNRFFSHWLVTRTNWEDGIIKTSEDVKLKMVPEDIHKIIGLPAIGRDVLESSIQEEDKDSFLEKHMYFLGRENCMINTAEAILKRPLATNISKQDADQFKIAFVVFIMGKFLAPTTNFYSGNYNFWHAVVNADEIKNYNWNGYVLSCLLDAARVVFFARFLKKEVNTIMGCPLLLQVIHHTLKLLLSFLILYGRRT